MAQHQALTDSKEDQLCLAAIQYLRSHFQEATDIYKRLLVEDREHWALNVYIAFCYYKLDYYDVALEILGSYLTNYPHSITAVNLKACSHYQLYNGKAAEAELKVLQQASNSGNIFQEHDLLQHNLVRAPLASSVHPPAPAPAPTPSASPSVMSPLPLLLPLPPILFLSPSPSASPCVMNDTLPPGRLPQWRECHPGAAAPARHHSGGMPKQEI